jgi:hypothetical protein
MQDGLVSQLQALSIIGFVYILLLAPFMVCIYSHSVIDIPRQSANMVFAYRDFDRIKDLDNSCDICLSLFSAGKYKKITEFDCS